MRSVLISGSTRQDGAYLADFLLEKKYVAHGTKRRASLLKTDRWIISTRLTMSKNVILSCTTGI
jgi:GDP-D-mannose dehydratase